MNQIKNAIIVVLSWVSLPVMAMDLLDTYRLAQAHDPAWQATLSLYLADQQHQAIAYAGLLPRVSATAALSRDRFDSANPQAVVVTQQQYMLSVRQPIFSPERWARYQQAQVLTQFNDAALSADRQAFVLQVAEAYFNLLHAQAHWSAWQTEATALEQQSVAMQARFAAGVVARNDVNEVLAQSQQVLANRLSAEVTLMTSREALAAILGQPVPPLAQLRQDLPYAAPYPNQVADWEALAAQHHPQIAVARLRATVALKDRNILAAAHQPYLELVGTASESQLDLPSQSLHHGGRLSIGLALTVPLYEGGQTTRLVRQSAYQVDAATAQIQVAERHAKAQVRSAFFRLQSDQAQLTARQTAVTSGELVVEASKIGYELGVRNIADLLAAQRAVFTARREQISVRYQYVLNVLRLRAAAGQLSAADLAELNTWLE